VTLSEDNQDPTAAPEDAEAQTVYVRLARAARVRPMPLAAVVALAAVLLLEMLPAQIATGQWTAVVLLIFGTLVAPVAFLIFLSRAPEEPVLELGPERLRLPITTRAQEYLTFRYREIQSLFVRGGTSPHIWIGTELGTFLYPVKSFASPEAARQVVELIRDRVATGAPDGEARLARFDAQQGVSDAAYASRLWGTKVILALMVLGFGVEVASGVTGGGPFAVARLGASAPSLVSGGDYYRLFVSTFLHTDAFHLLVNGMLVAALGSMVERLLGTWPMLIAALLAALLGPLSSALSGLATLSMGASTVVFGLLGLYGFVAYRYRGRLPLGFAPPIRTWITLGLLLVLMAMALPGSDFPAHLGGFLAGVLVAAPLVDRDPVLPLRRAPGLVAWGALLLLGGAGVGSMGWAVQAFLHDDGTAELKVLEDFVAHRQIPAATGNAVAWALALDPKAQPRALELAETLSRRAVSEAEGDEPKAMMQDTLATVLYRQGRLDEAIALEASLLHLGDTTMPSQLARFLRARLNTQGVLHDEGAQAGGLTFTTRHHDARGFGLDLTPGQDLGAPRTVWLLVERGEVLEGMVRLPIPANPQEGKTLWLRALGIEPVWLEGVSFRLAWVQPGQAEAQGWLMRSDVLEWP
jgi:rhomboid protease GluP